jgi:hypothetical protein
MSKWKNIYLKARKVAGMPPMMEEQLGCSPDKFDSRDKKKIVKSVNELPDEALLDNINPNEVINQGRAGSCAGCAARQAVYLLTKKLPNKKLHFFPPHLYIYYKCREYMGTVNQDSGSHLRYIMKVLKDGVPPYMYHPYIDQWRNRPSRDAVEEAAFKIRAYERIPSGRPETLETIQRVLAEEGLPIIFGSRIYQDGMNIAGRKGRVDMDEVLSGRYLGGHAMLLTGYRTSQERGVEFQVLNSWGSRWGHQGYFWVPAEFITSVEYTFDLWTFSKQYW